MVAASASAPVAWEVVSGGYATGRFWVTGKGCFFRVVSFGSAGLLQMREGFIFGGRAGEGCRGEGAFDGAGEEEAGVEGEEADLGRGGGEGSVACEWGYWIVLW